MLRTVLALSSAIFLTPAPVPAASPRLSHEAFARLKGPKPAEVLRLYTQFARKVHLQNQDFNQQASFFELIASAHASTPTDCLFAGWPSRLENGICRSPRYTNEGYKPLHAESCGSEDTLLCNPALFGEDLCVSIGNPEERRVAFLACIRKFEQSGGKLATQAETVSKDTGTLKTLYEELTLTIERICSNPGPLCRALSANILALAR